jgi:hypothetical protein
MVGMRNRARITLRKDAKGEENRERPQRVAPPESENAFSTKLTRPGEFSQKSRGVLGMEAPLSCPTSLPEGFHQQ